MAARGGRPALTAPARGPLGKLRKLATGAIADDGARPGCLLKPKGSPFASRLAAMPARGDSRALRGRPTAAPGTPGGPTLTAAPGMRLSADCALRCARGRAPMAFTAPASLGLAA